MPASDRARSRSRAPFVLKSLLTAALVAAVVFFAVIPPAPLQTPAANPPDPRVIAGAYHLHTTRSDGALDRDAVARAASRAGLKFAIFTDHGDGAGAPTPPEYLHGVLCVDGVEVSTNQGHYVALGIGQSPYPLGGDADAVAEDVARLGGFGIAAHPFSARHELAWGDWAVPVDGVEWLNADSEWRDERRAALGYALIGYLARPAGALASLLDRPVSTLAKWDDLAQRRRIVALPAHDAHGGLGKENGDSRGRTLPLPSYESTFRTFSARVILDAPPSGDAGQDAALLLAAIREGAAFSVVDAIAGPGSLDFRAAAGGVIVPMGGMLPSAIETATFTVRADVPALASTSLLRNGQVVVERAGGALEHTSADQGSYRVEIHVPGAAGTPPVPWLVSNPIYWFRPASAAPRSQPDAAVALPLAAGAWRTEHSPGSSASVTPEEPAVAFAYRLAGGGVASQFAALVRDLAAPPDFAAVTFAARASRPMRISTQLRFARDGDQRWRKSFYADTVGRPVRIAVDQLRPTDPSGPRPAVSRASSLLFVVDLTNAAPAAEGSFTISDVALVR
jgi:hypothetical protein